MKCVSIEWFDPVGRDREGWIELDHALKDDPSNCHTVGWVLKETKREVIVSHTYCKDPEATMILGYITIPKSVIRKMKVLK